MTELNDGQGMTVGGWKNSYKKLKKNLGVIEAEMIQRGIEIIRLKKIIKRAYSTMDKDLVSKAAKTFKDFEKRNTSKSRKTEIEKAKKSRH